MSVLREIGHLQRERGARAEDRVLDAVGSMREPWILGVRQATHAEDANGIDVVVSTDVGKLFLQVKSSKAGLQRWRAKNRRLGLTKKREHIGLVRAYDQLQGDALIAVVRAELQRLRSVFLKERGVPSRRVAGGGSAP